MPIYRKLEVTDISTNTTKSFDMIKQASLEYNISRTAFGKYINGKYKHPIHGRYTCKYIN